jgi:tRNA threonylcarbamoyladenosine biosynthesis protein TsaB
LTLATPVERSALAARVERLTLATRVERYCVDMRILALDSAVGSCSVTLVSDAAMVAGRAASEARDAAALMPDMVRACLRESGWSLGQVDAIAVTVGPGSFTGIRTGLALAHGISVATGRPITAVTVGEAIRERLHTVTDRPVWCVIASRRGRIFLDTEGGIQSLAEDAIPMPDRAIVVAGPAAADAASRLAARGADVMLSDVMFPSGIDIAQVGARRLAGTIAPRPAEPLYIDAPEAKPLPGPDAKPAV